MRTNNRDEGILSSDAKASFSLIIARIVYGINWFNISAIFPLIALEFNKDVSLLGFMSAGFFAGVGLFQIPAGIFAAIHNPRISAIVSAPLIGGFYNRDARTVLLIVESEPAGP